MESFLIILITINTIAALIQEINKTNIVIYPPKIRPAQAINSTSPNPMPSRFLIALYIALAKMNNNPAPIKPNTFNKMALNEISSKS